MTEIIEKKYKINGCLINTISFGQGIPLLMIPGWPITGRVYELLEQYLSDKYKVISFDFPGWAGKSKFTTDKTGKVSFCLEIIKKLLFLVYPNELINLVGVSAGGTLALLTAADCPQKINKVFIQSAPFAGGVLLDEYPLKTKLMNLARTTSALGTFLKYYYICESVFCEVKSGSKPVNKKLIYEVFKDYKTLDPKITLEFACEFFNSDYSEVMKKIKNKVIVIGCGNDEIVSPGLMEDLVKILPNAVYCNIPKHGHRFLSENPREFAVLIRKYIN